MFVGIVRLDEGRRHRMVIVLVDGDILMLSDPPVPLLMDRGGHQVPPDDGGVG